MKKNNLLKTVLWFVFVLLMMQSCREESTVIENQNLKSKIKINRITKEQFDKNENLKINLDKFLSKKSKPKTSASREIYNEYYDFTILTDNISEVDNGGTKSYTFEIKRSNNINHNILENLMMYPEKEGYQFALVQYHLTSEDFYNFKRGKKIDLKEKVKITKLDSNKISLSARLFSCLKTYTTWVPYDPNSSIKWYYFNEQYGVWTEDTDGHYEYVTILGVCDDGATGFTGQTSGSTVPTYSGGHPTVGENYLEYNDLVNKMYTDTNLTTKITEIEKKWLNNNLEDWYIDRDMFRDYLTYNYFEGGTSIAKLQACVFVAKTAALLNLSTSTDWETQVLPFLNFTYNFKIQNPNTSWTQFQNWFVEGDQDFNRDLLKMIVENNHKIPQYTSSDFPGMNNGMPYNWWNDENYLNNMSLGFNNINLTKEEKKMCALFPLAAVMIFSNKDIALNEASSTFPNQIPHNNKADAFRHAFFNALNTRDVYSQFSTRGTFTFAKNIVRMFGIAHESEVPQELLLEKAMDLYNNEGGIEVCSTCNPLTNPTNLVKGYVLSLLNEGKLVHIWPLNNDQTIRPDSNIYPTNQH